MGNWDNRLILKNLSRIETYFERRLSVIRDLKIFGARYGVDSSALCNEEVKIFEASATVVLSEFDDWNDRN